MKYIFLINRFSLKKNTEKMAEVIKKVCKRRKIDYEVLINNKKFSTEEIMERFNYTKHTIFAIGGDGSMNRVLNAIIKTNNTFSYCEDFLENSPLHLEILFLIQLIDYQ